MHESTSSRIEFEIAQTERLLQAYGGLLDRVQQVEPTLVELTATASVLHSFYTAVENILLAIAKGIDGQVPERSHWHRDLLLQMTSASASRPVVLDKETARRLGEYLAFRHFYRHAYSFILEWHEMENLVIGLEKVWDQTKTQLQAFAETIRS